MKFVARPEQAPSSAEWLYRHPDGHSDVPGQTWRQQLVAYNTSARDNPLCLLEAYRLYQDSVYKELVVACGLTNVFILSAGWGLVRADYRLPDYDITFASTKPADRYKRRMPGDKYDDFFQLAGGEVGPVVCFVTKHYWSLLQKVTDPLHCEKVVFFATNDPPNCPQWTPIPFRRFTNWQYTCAKEFLPGKLSI